MVFGSSKKHDKKNREREFVIQPPTPAPPVREPVKRESSFEAPGDASYIGKTMKIEGELASDEDLTIEGHVKGTIKVGKILTIGRHGSVTADIEARVVKVIGTAKGNIKATEKVAILSEGRVCGNIWSEVLVVSEGAILIGNVNQDEEKKKPAPVEKKKAPEKKPEPVVKEEQEAKEKKEPEEKKENTHKQDQKEKPGEKKSNR